MQISIGHKDTRMTRGHYAHLLWDKLKETVDERLPSHIARKGAVLVRSVIAVTVSAERLFERLKHGLRLLNFRERLSIAF